MQGRSWWHERGLAVGAALAMAVAATAAPRTKPAAHAASAAAPLSPSATPAGSGTVPAANASAVAPPVEFLPVSVLRALDRAQLPRDALVAMVVDVNGGPPRLVWQPQRPVNPASLTKLFTTAAALDLLGPGWNWTTGVWLQGAVRDPGPKGVLDGNLVIQGSGDPKLVFERLWLLLRRVRETGVQEIHGDIVLDRRAFVVPAASPADFDGEPTRPYNVRPDALLLNYKSLVLTFLPEAERGRARIAVEPRLAGVTVPADVAVASGPCEDWRAALKADFSDPAQVRFAGTYPIACGERQWPVAYADPASYNGRAIAGLWREMGGQLTGTAHDGDAPTTAPTFEIQSPALADVVRDINKYSNNVMAQQLFLTLGRIEAGAGTPEASREVLHRWLATRLGEAARAVVIDNGSGLSRETRVSAEALSRLLLSVWSSPTMPELMSSLPVSGVDGTLKRAGAAPGRAHLKTGTLRDASGIAGYVLGPEGRRYVVVAIVNHPNAAAARPVLDAVLQWAADGAGATGASPAKGSERRVAHPGVD